MTSPAKRPSVKSSLTKKIRKSLLGGNLEQLVSGTNFKELISGGKRSKEKKVHRIVASNDVPFADVINGLNLLKISATIESAEVVDMLLSNSYKQYIPRVQSIVFSGEAPARKIVFADHLQIKQYDAWKARKDKMMDAYKHGINYFNCPTVAAWQAVVVLPEGTDVVLMEEFLSNLQADLSCNYVSFEAPSLKNTDLVSEVPEKLCSLIGRGDGEDLLLKEEVSVLIACGGFSRGDWSKLLEDCSVKLSKIIAKGRVPRKKTKLGSSDGSSQMRHSKSAPELQELIIDDEKTQSAKKNRRRSSKSIDPAAEKKNLNSSAHSANSFATVSTTGLSSSSFHASENWSSELKEIPTDEKQCEDQQTATAERITISWKEFGERNRQRLSVGRAKALKAGGIKQRRHSDSQLLPHEPMESNSKSLEAWC